MRKLLKGEKHHWWPKGLSKYWGNEQGLVYRKDSSGKIIRSKPKAFGQISDGHNILFDEEMDFPQQNGHAKSVALLVPSASAPAPVT